MTDSVNLSAADAILLQRFRRPSGGVDDIAQLLIPPCDINDLTLICILDRDNHLLVTGQTYAGSHERLVQRLIEILRDTEALAG